MNYEDQRRASKHPKFVKFYKNIELQDYNPLLLLQSMLEVSLHAKRIYQDGVTKFMRKTKGIYDSKRVEQYELLCVCKAQEHVKDLLRISYAAEKKAKAGQITQHEETAFEAPPILIRWEREPKWASVFTQIKAEKKRIASKMKTGPLIKLVSQVNISLGDSTR
jgi:hypothetical protein